MIKKKNNDAIEIINATFNEYFMWFDTWFIMKKSFVT